MRHSTCATLLLAGLSMAGIAAAPASATPLTTSVQTNVVPAGDNPMLIDVAKRKHHKRYWSRKHHGPRCKYRHGNCRHFHNGYWYATPWWLFSAPFVGGRIVIHEGSSRHAKHIAWCEDHYRSYKRRNNTWVSYSGVVHQCNSPYDNR